VSSATLRPRSRMDGSLNLFVLIFGTVPYCGAGIVQ
jgi:hypothetical protein